jgi:hypothetical protein
VPWFVIAAFVVGLVASLFLQPKVKTENARASTLNDLNFPRAQEGDPVPWFIGRVRNKGPNTLWAGDFEARPIKKKQKTGLFSSKTVITGYNYYVGLVLSWGLGPDVTLHRIWSEKDDLWVGTANVDDQALVINKPDLYGGKDQGGGFTGTISFYTGSFAQPINAYYQSKQGSGDVPAYRGSVLTILEHCCVGEQNTLRALSAEMSRYPNGLGIPGGMHIIGDDANPMEALYQIYTSDWGGLDTSAGLIDLTSWLDCATTLYNEANGISLIVTSASDGKTLTDEIMRQINGVLYNDPETGLIVCKLIRNDFGDIETLPVFDESNVVSVAQFTRKLWSDTINTVRITYTNRDKQYEDGTAMQQDMANIGAQGKVRPSTASYPGVSNGDLANWIAARDLAVSSVPLMSAQLQTNRQGASLRPGDRFVWTWGPYKLAQVVMRVKDFDLGSLTDNRVVINVVQDEFAVSDTIIGSPVSSGVSLSTPNLPANPVASRIVKECPYFLASASGLAIASAQSVIMVAAQAPTATSDRYDVYTSRDGGTTYGVSEENVVFTDIGTLATAITSTANLSTGVIPNLTINIADASDLESHTAAEVAQGANLMLIDGELFAFEALVVGSGTITVSNVWRSLLDTSPGAHAIGTNVYFLDGGNVIEDLFPATATVDVKLATKTFDNTMDYTTDVATALTLNNRCNRPLPPACIQFNGGAIFAPPANGATPATITWANRNRLLSKVRKIADATSEYESGQQTVIRWRKNGGAWTQTSYAPGIATATIATGSVAGDTIDWEIWSTRDGLDSFAKWQFTSGAAAPTGSSPETTIAGGSGAPSTPADTTTAYVVPPDSLSIIFPFGTTIGTDDIDIPITFAINIPAGLTGTNVDHTVNPAATATFTLKKNGVAVGTIAISAAGAYTFTAAAPIALVAGDSFTCSPPAVQDSALKGVNIGIAGTRG